MDPLDVGVQADDRVVPDQALDRGGDRVPDDLGGRRVRSELGDGELSRMRRPRPERANDLGRRVGRAGAALAQTGDERFDQVVVGLVERLHLELAEARRDLAPVENGYVIVDDVREAAPIAVAELGLPANGSQPNLRPKRCRPHERAHEIDGLRRRPADGRPGTRAPRGRASPPLAPAAA